MTLYMVLLVAVMAIHPSLGAKIPDINLNSRPSDDDGSIVFRSVNSTTDNMMTDNGTPAPPRKATFITECHVDTPFMAGVCWIDETTVLMLDALGSKIIKLNIDLRLRLCEASVLYSNIRGYSMSCASDGVIYVNDWFNKVVRIINGTSIVQWKPDKAPHTNWFGGIAVNNDTIALDFDYKPVNLYSRLRERKFLYNISSEADKYNRKAYLSLSPSSPPSPSPSYLVSSAPESNYTFIHDLVQNTTIKIGGSGKEEGKLNYPWSTSFDSSGRFILVSEGGNRRISVFTVGGQFSHVLELGPGGSNSQISYLHATIHREGKPSLLAVEVLPRNTFKIYSLST